MTTTALHIEDKNMQLLFSTSLNTTFTIIINTLQFFGKSSVANLHHLYNYNQGRHLVAPLTYFNDGGGGGGGSKDFFGSDILAKRDFFGSRKQHRDFF